MLSIHNNFASTRFVTRHLGKASRIQSDAMEKLSSGFRINKASDDPSGLLISEQLRAQIDGLERAVRNVDESGSLLDIMDGGLSQVQDLLKRMQNLAIHAANQGVTSADQVSADQAEMDNALLAINKILGTTEYGGRKLLSNVESNLFGSGKQVTSPSGELVEEGNADLLKRDYTFVVQGSDENGESLETTLSFKKGQSLDDVLAELRNVDPSSVLGADSEEDETQGVFVEPLGSTVTLDATALENLKNLSDDEAKNTLSGMMTKALFDSAGLIGSGDGFFHLGDGSGTGILLDDISQKDKELIEISNNLGNLNLGSLGTIQVDENGEKISGYSLQDLFSGGAASLSRDPAMALKILRDAHDQIGMTRASIGASRAYQEHYKEAKEIELENLTRSESGIRDADMATSMVEFTKASILTQVGTKMLSSMMDSSKKMVLDLFA